MHIEEEEEVIRIDNLGIPLLQYLRIGDKKRDHGRSTVPDEILNSNSMPPLVKPLSRQSFDSSKNPSQGEKSRENSPSRFFDSNSSQYTLQSTQSTWYSHSLGLTVSQRELLSSASSDHPKTPAPVLQTASSTRDSPMHTLISSSN